MKIKVGKLETPYHKMQLKFAGLESLMTENLQEQLIKPAISHKDRGHKDSISKEVDQLNQEISAMMVQRDDNESTPTDTVTQRVKKFM